MSPKTLVKRAKTEARLKKSLSKIYDKHHPKGVITSNALGNVLTQTLAKVAEKVENPLAQKGGTISRNDLMLRAKELGVKNFRVLNKAELVEVTDPACTPCQRDAVVAQAVARWKSGWAWAKTKQQ